MRVLQPAEWSKPRGFSHGVVVDGPGQWIVLAGQTGGDEKGDYPADMGKPGRRRAEADHEAAGRGWRRSTAYRAPDRIPDQPRRIRGGGGRHWCGLEGNARHGHPPPSTLLYIGGLVDSRAKVEIEVTAFVPAA